MKIHVESVEFLDVPPNSVLIVKVPSHAFSEATAIKLRQTLLNKRLKNVVDVLIISKEVDLLVVAKEEE